MGFILFLIAVIFVSLIILIVHLASKSNTPSHFYPNTDSFDDDPDQDHSSSSFPYPDPYELPPEQAAYLGEDGDILEDL